MVLSLDLDPVLNVDELARARTAKKALAGH
jgi:hypothetical protein